MVFAFPRSHIEAVNTPLRMLHAKKNGDGETKIKGTLNATDYKKNKKNHAARLQRPAFASNPARQ